MPWHSQAPAKPDPEPQPRQRADPHRGRKCALVTRFQAADRGRQGVHVAYDDPIGVTAAFNLNILERINRAFGNSFDLGAFAHEARFNEDKSRIEMHLVSKLEQTVEVLGCRFTMRSGETIHTENSHKYTIAGFGDLAGAAG